MGRTIEAARAARLFDLTGQHAVVTGAAGGLGFAIARVLAANGAAVTLADIDAERVATAAASLAEQGAAAYGEAVDIGDRTEVERLMSRAASRQGGVQIVFANAGISAGMGHRFGVGNLDRLDDERWQRVLEVNLTGTLHTIRAAAAQLPEGGRIIATTSVAGHRADPLVGYAYSASKAAVSHLVRGAADELAGRGIRVNAIAPGSFRTEIGQANPRNEEMLAELRRATALDRLAEPEEIEGIALLLASRASAHITGAVFTIDGGVMIHQS